MGNYRTDNFQKKRQNHGKNSIFAAIYLAINKKIIKEYGRKDHVSTSNRA